MAKEADYEVTYDSIADLAKVAKRHVTNGDYANSRNGDFDEFMHDWADVRSWRDAESMAVNGWASESDAALSIAESAVEAVSKDHDMPTFSSTWDVAGCEVDVDRYLAGVPENMIDYEPVPTPRNGRVIVLCASTAFSSAVSSEAIKRRGYTVAALAFALARIGFAIELWADASSTGIPGNKGRAARMRVLVKGANDELDVARIMFAYSHPAMFRALCMPAFHDYPEDVRDLIGVGGFYGYPANPKQDMPEGTIYLPSVLSDRDVPNADAELTRYLTDLGIVA